MQKNFKYLIWLIIIISHSAFGLITDELSSRSSANYNATGIIINKNYKSDLAITPNIIRTYRYVECNASAELTKNNTIKKLTDINKYENTLFALIPREYGTAALPSSDMLSDQILHMNSYLNANYLSHSIKNKNTITTTQDLINQESQLYLQRFNNYLIEQKLINNFSEEKQATINKSIVGNYGLFMPPNMQILNKFNGYGRTLPLAVSIMEDLLITTDDFNSVDTTIIKDQFINSQYLIFKAMELAKTVIFIPKFTTHKENREIRLPIALINKVSLDLTSSQITLSLLFCEQAINSYLGFFNFIDARNSLLGIDNKIVEWEFIDYIFKLDSSDNLKLLKYKATNAEIQVNSYINEQDNNMPYETANETYLLAECRLPNAEELNQIKLNKENNYYTHELLSGLLLTYDHSNENINKKLFDMQNSNNITTDTVQQHVVIKELIEYKNHNFKDQCKSYGRKCLVKFNCCDEYWCCHRKHNATTTTSCNRKTKAKDINFIKCLICDYKQIFSEYCQRCNTKFSEYCCNICKHLTRKKKHPYHCDKCGTCRFDGNKSFHCDTCGVCFDVKVKDNHKHCDNFKHGT